MEVSADLAREALAAALPERPVRTYPALVSTEADALAWARSGAPHGAVVVADYQLAAHGRAGVEWAVVPGRDLAFSVVLRPQLEAEREGWLYTVATTALADVCGDDAAIAWPDEVLRAGRRLGALAAQVDTESTPSGWAVVSFHLPNACPHRAARLARLVPALERRCADDPREVLALHCSRCETLGRRVIATLLPLGPNAVRVAGVAVATRDDGSLVIETDAGRRVAVPPQTLGFLEDG